MREIQNVNEIKSPSITQFTCSIDKEMHNFLLLMLMRTYSLCLVNNGFVYEDKMKNICRHVYY